MAYVPLKCAQELKGVSRNEWIIEYHRLYYFWLLFLTLLLAFVGERIMILYATLPFLWLYFQRVIVMVRGQFTGQNINRDTSVQDFSGHLSIVYYYVILCFLLELIYLQSQDGLWSWALILSFMYCWVFFLFTQEIWDFL